MKIKKILAVIFTVFIVIGLTCFSCFAADGEVSTGFSEGFVTSPSMVESSGENSTAGGSYSRLEQSKMMKIYNSYGNDLTNTTFHRVGDKYYVCDWGDNGYVNIYQNHEKYGQCYFMYKDAYVYEYSGGSWVKVSNDNGALNSGAFPCGTTWDDINASEVFCYSYTMRKYGNQFKQYYPNFSTTGLGDFAPSDFSSIMSGIKSLLPVIVPTIVGFLALRKGWRFVKGETATA